MYLELDMTNILVINENIKCPICRSISQISISSEIHDEFNCSKCLDNIMVESNISICKLSCNHYFCMECINKYIENNKKYNQPIIINNTNIINNISECMYINIWYIYNRNYIFLLCYTIYIMYRLLI